MRNVKRGRSISIGQSGVRIIGDLVRFKARGKTEIGAVTSRYVDDGISMVNIEYGDDETWECRAELVEVLPEPVPVAEYFGV